jgi:hypothetical protein
MEVSMTSRIKIKLGPIEVEYEGSEAFLKEELPDLLTAVAKLYKDSDSPISTPSGGNPNAAGSAGTVIGTVNSIAHKLSSKSGSDLILAACAFLKFVEQKDTFSRDEIAKQMKAATDFYKDSYSGGNLTKYLKTLQGNGKINERSKGVYALTAAAIKELGPKLAN